MLISGPAPQWILFLMQNQSFQGMGMCKNSDNGPLTIIAYFIQVNESANAVYLIINQKCLNCLNNQIP